MGFVNQQTQLVISSTSDHKSARKIPEKSTFFFDQSPFSSGFSRRPKVSPSPGFAERQRILTRTVIFWKWQWCKSGFLVEFLWDFYGFIGFLWDFYGSFRNRFIGGSFSICLVYFLGLCKGVYLQFLWLYVACLQFRYLKWPRYAMLGFLHDNRCLPGLNMAFEDLHH